MAGHGQSCVGKAAHYPHMLSLSLVPVANSLLSHEAKFTHRLASKPFTNPRIGIMNDLAMPITFPAALGKQTDPGRTTSPKPLSQLHPHPSHPACSLGRDALQCVRTREMVSLGERRSCQPTSSTPVSFPQC